MNEPSIAVFIDFENLAIGARDLKGSVTFDIAVVLKRLLEKGRIVYKRAYSDWGNYRNELREFHAQGIELVDIPQSKIGGKNSADIHMVVDAIDLCHIKDNIDIFALVSGDSDFSPLVSKLKENNKRVIGCGIKNSSSHLLVSNCDEFIYYDDLIQVHPAKPCVTPKKRTAQKTGKTAASRPRKKAPQKEAEEKPVPDEKQELLMKVMEIITSLQADYDPLWGSLIKQTVRRVQPGFQERHYGYGTFAELLEDLETLGYIDLDYDHSRGNYMVCLISD